MPLRLEHFRRLQVGLPGRLRPLLFSRRFPRFAESSYKAARARIQTSRSRCGCRQVDGMADFTDRAMADLPERSIIAEWQLPSAADPPRQEPTPGTRDLPSTRPGPWDIRKR